MPKGALPPGHHVLGTKNRSDGDGFLHAAGSNGTSGKPSMMGHDDASAPFQTLQGSLTPLPLGRNSETTSANHDKLPNGLRLGSRVRIHSLTAHGHMSFNGLAATVQGMHGHRVKVKLEDPSRDTILGLNPANLEAIVMNGNGIVLHQNGSIAHTGSNGNMHAHATLAEPSSTEMMELKKSSGAPSQEEVHCDMMPSPEEVHSDMMLRHIMRSSESLEESADSFRYSETVRAQLEEHFVNFGDDTLPQTEKEQVTENELEKPFHGRTTQGSVLVASNDVSGDVLEADAPGKGADWEISEESLDPVPELGGFSTKIPQESDLGLETDLTKFTNVQRLDSGASLHAKQQSSGLRQSVAIKDQPTILNLHHDIATDCIKEEETEKGRTDTMSQFERTESHPTEEYTEKLRQALLTRRNKSLLNTQASNVADRSVFSSEYMDRFDVSILLTESTIMSEREWHDRCFLLDKVCKEMCVATRPSAPNKWAVRRFAEIRRSMKIFSVADIVGIRNDDFNYSQISITTKAIRSNVMQHCDELGGVLSNTSRSKGQKGERMEVRFGTPAEKVRFLDKLHSVMNDMVVFDA